MTICVADYTSIRERFPLEWPFIYRRTTCTPAGRDFSEIAISGWNWLMPDQHTDAVGARFGKRRDWATKHLCHPVVGSDPAFGS